MENITLSSSEMAYIIHVLSEYYFQELFHIEDPLNEKAQRLKKLATVLRLLSLRFAPYEKT